MLRVNIENKLVVAYKEKSMQKEIENLRNNSLKKINKLKNRLLKLISPLSS